ncbi:hypothetical protein BU24DRAFT_405927 [Aaosphaeria arxii CBS 175.79]|uniref:Uncharacterized protein n=1 Tax=Aaosphaeria arxii CBS 175.79 TaxID=1450172 RepID=A0A6A5Y1W9_9PLEO|nr:uncharacterized protein BU24DRAFT_405927 [Aaosphaeria arxii CBS 175.79]KAF2019226.1 hypothetical protein BU24DRAFT_405927 [Aaosphaeria arxii CBS 175.79]
MPQQDPDAAAGEERGATDDGAALRDLWAAVRLLRLKGSCGHLYRLWEAYCSVIKPNNALRFRPRSTFAPDSYYQRWGIRYYDVFYGVANPEDYEGLIVDTPVNEDAKMMDAGKIACFLFIGKARQLVHNHPDIYRVSWASQHIHPRRVYFAGRDIGHPYPRRWRHHFIIFYFRNGKHIVFDPAGMGYGIEGHWHEFDEYKEKYFDQQHQLLEIDPDEIESLLAFDNHFVVMKQVLERMSNEQLRDVANRLPGITTQLREIFLAVQQENVQV